MSEFVIGQIYNRRRDIHDRFGGQRQSGIVTPAQTSLVFVFTGRGKRHGYHDEWSPDGSAPRRRGLPVEEDSTRRVVD